MMEDQLLTTKEDRGDRPSIGIGSEVTDGGEQERVAQNFREKDPHHGKAAQADNAEVQVDVWNQRVAEQLTFHWASEQTQFHLEPEFAKSLNDMRGLSLRWWKQNVYDDFYKWFEEKGCHHPEAADILVAGKSAITKAEQALFWEWDLGSALFFWRWPEHYQDMACKGIAPMFDSDPPCSKDKQPKYRNEAIREKVQEKLDKVVAKGYIELIDIKFMDSIMYIFHVAKGDDIRMVYNGSKLGLNAAIYAPWFALPTTKSMTR